MDSGSENVWWKRGHQKNWYEPLDAHTKLFQGVFYLGYHADCK